MGGRILREAAKMEWARANIHSGLLPNSADEERKKAVRRYGFLKRIPKRWAMWKALEDLINGKDDATGRLILETEETDDGEQRYIRVLTRKDIIDDFSALPLIHLDATMPFDLVKHFLPDLDLILDLKVEAPHMRITQVVGMPVGKAALVPKPPGKRKGKQRAHGRRRRKRWKRASAASGRLVDAVRHLAQGRRGLVITYKDIEDDFAAIDGVEVAHFGAIEGIDRWGDVDVTGDHRPAAAQAGGHRAMAAAITGKPVIAGDMVEQMCDPRRAEPGRSSSAESTPTPEADMIRQAVTEAAIEQAIGRVRGVNRTAANPVEVFLILDDIVVPGLPVDEVVEFSDLEPDAIDHMISRGLVPQMGTDAAKLHPDLFPVPEDAARGVRARAARVAGGTRRREVTAACPRFGTWSYRGSLLRDVPLLPRWPVFNHRAPASGRGLQFDPVKFSDLRVVLEDAFGPLVHFEV